MDVHSAAPCINQRVDWQNKIYKPYNTIQLLDEKCKQNSHWILNNYCHYVVQAYSKSCGLYDYDNHVILIKFNYFYETGYNVAYNNHTNLWL